MSFAAMPNSVAISDAKLVVRNFTPLRSSTELISLLNQPPENQFPTAHVLRDNWDYEDRCGGADIIYW